MSKFLDTFKHHGVRTIVRRTWRNGRWTFHVHSRGGFSWYCGERRPRPSEIRARVRAWLDGLMECDRLRDATKAATADPEVKP